MCGNKRKIVLVGTGMVGMSFAYSALNRGLCDTLVLVDVDKKRAMGEAMDLNHGLAFAGSSMKIYAGEYSDCSDADMVVISAGVGPEARGVQAGAAKAQYRGISVYYRAGGALGLRRGLPGGYKPGGHYDPGDLRALGL